MLRTSASGKRTWYWHRKLEGKWTRKRIADAGRMSLLEARAYVARGGAPENTAAEVAALEAENRVLEARLAECKAHAETLAAANRTIVVSLNAMIAQMEALGVKPQRTRVSARPDGTIEADVQDIDRQTPTLADVAERWWNVHEGTWSEASRKAYRTRLDGHILPALGARPVDSIEPREVAEFLNAAPSASTAKVLSFILRGSLGLALAEGMVASNAADAARALVKRRTETVAHRAALPVDDVPGVFAELPDTPAAQAVKLAILTAVRINAISGGDRREVEGGIWTVPEDRQSKGKRTPRIPLPPAALECLDGLGIHANNVRAVIAGRPFTLHGFRATFRSWCQRPEQSDISFEAKELALGHTVGTAVQRAYERDDLLAERRVLMQRWAAFVTGG